MTPSKWSLALLALVIGVFAATDTWAHGRGRSSVHLGFHFGYPGWYYAPAPYWYYPPPVVYSPPVYVERYVEQAPPPPDVTGPQPSAPHYWYYCRESQTYFPYVKECPSAWQRVVPEAPRQ